MLSAILVTASVFAQSDGRWSSGSAGSRQGAAAHRAASSPAFPAASPQVSVPWSHTPVRQISGFSEPGLGAWGVGSPGINGFGGGFPAPLWPCGPGFSLNLLCNTGLPNFGWNYSSASWSQVGPPGFGWGSGWNSGFGPWVMPPALLRNSDGALFFPPVYGPYGSCVGYAAWPAFQNFYGMTGAAPSWAFASPIWPGHGFVSSGTGLSVLLNPPLVHGNSVPFAFEADGATEFLPDDDQFPPHPGDAPAPPEPDRDAAPDRGAAPEQGSDNEHDSGPDYESESDLDSTSTGLESEEFPAIEVRDEPSSLSARLRSLRHQAAGDDFFREQKYEAAQESYEAALAEAGERRAPWLRMALVLIARQQFEQAAAYLKTGLRLSGDRTRAWITAEELYGARARQQTQAQALALWEWVGLSPLSADRLLLAGSFQKMRGDHRTAAELLSLASRGGAETDLARALREVAADDAQAAADNRSAPADVVPDRSRQMSAPRVRNGPPARPAASTSRTQGGIYLRGRSADRTPPVEAAAVEDHSGAVSGRDARERSVPKVVTGTHSAQKTEKTDERPAVD